VSRSILTDARSTLSTRVIKQRSRFEMADRLARFALLVDKLTREDLPTSRSDEEGAMWNHALTVLRQKLGLEVP
jgi:hypothetical protein